MAKVIKVKCAPNGHVNEVNVDKLLRGTTITEACRISHRKSGNAMCPNAATAAEARSSLPAR